MSNILEIFKSIRTRLASGPDPRSRDFGDLQLHVGDLKTQAVTAAILTLAVVIQGRGND